MTMTYEESVKYLYKIAGFATKSSLEDIKYFLERLGNPQKELHMIHVAGTNGKGSVCAFLEALLTQHGKKTASFTSPHVVKINERIKLCAKEISDERFVSAAVKVRHAIETGITEGKNSPSFFEAVFLMAMVIFQEEQPDICMIETGMGGRYDATNVICPKVSVITSISEDHMEFLGQTLEEIATHKAGIIKPGIPVVTIEQEPKVKEILSEEARQKKSRIYDISEDNLNFKEKAGKYIDFLNANAYDKERDVRTNIAGEFQKSNLVAALQTAELICGRLDEDKIYEALSQIRISGRMEEIAPGIIVDVSHNIQGMQGFVQTVEANYHGMKKRILFAASHQNEEEYMKNILKTIPEIEAFYTVGIHKRRIDEAEFQDAFRKMIDTIGMTDIGNGRPSNQDAYLLRQKEKNGKLYLLAVVCDGMGGLKKGEIASHYIVEVLKQWFDETLFDGLETMGIDMIEQNLIDLIRRINQNLLLMSRRMEETKSMGSTLTLLFVEEHEFFVLNVGDSRTYWFDRNRKFVTTDHTLAELELRAGHLTKEQAKKDPRRHILIQCVGVTKDIRIDCYKGRLNPGMEFLLCTDGFYGLLEEEEIYQVEASKEQIKEWVQKCFQKVKRRGELDNLSCVIVKVPNKK